LGQVQCDKPARIDYGSQSKAWLVGNGGSAAVASHIANDLVKMGKGAIALVDPPTLTCQANDEGWDEAFAKQISVHARAGDQVICISSSGKSENILNAAYAARHACRAYVITLSGFEATNPLRSLGDHNYYVPSLNYGIVEVCHLAILHGIVKPV
jgi:D-sedoheptulose 7-phosphate isomerase